MLYILAALNWILTVAWYTRECPGIALLFAILGGFCLLAKLVSAR